MHDPIVVAWDIQRPWPRIRRKDWNGQKRWFQARYSWAKWYKPWSGWMKFWRVGPFELYWPGLITIWHNEPKGRDSGEVCKHHVRWQDEAGKWHSKPKRAWKYHVHHWSIQVHPWQHFRRWAFTRCEWCNGRSRKGDYVNCSKQWDRERGPWWRGESGLFHSDCSSISTAHATCLCRDSVWSNGDYGRCVTCGKFRAWKSADREADPSEITTPLLASIPEGQRDPEKYAMVAALWRQHRDEERGES